MKRIVFLILSLLSPLSALVQAESSEAGPDAAYAQVVRQRADKLVATLSVTDSESSARVRDAVARHYQALRGIDEERDAALQAVKVGGGDASLTEAAQRDAELKRSAAHRELLGRLYADLTLEQIEGVKNGLTYNVFPNTYRVYLDMLPDLSDGQRAQIKAWLAEAREYAMDGGSSEEKHKWFGKYKGKINNYLSAAGYDMKKAERDLAERRKQAKAQK